MVKIHSVSLIFEFQGSLLLCTEMRQVRKGEDKELKSHLIGGKMEKYERPLECGIREFKEELPFNFNKKLMYDNIIKTQPNIVDLYINTKKDLYHRCYIVDISKIKNQRLQTELKNVELNFDKDKSLLKSVFYCEDITLLENKSSLLDEFIISTTN